MESKGIDVMGRGWKEGEEVWEKDKENKGGGRGREG